MKNIIAQNFCFYLLEMDIKVDTSPTATNVLQTESEKKLLRYSDHEKQILYGLFKEYGDIIDRHKRRFSKHKSKRSELQEAWQEILTRFNNHRNTTQRNLKQIQKFWLNTRLRKSIMEEGRNNSSQFPGYDVGGSSSGDQKNRVFAMQKQMKYEKMMANVEADESRDYRDEKWHIINQHQQHNQSNDYEEADDEDEESNDGRDDNNSANIMVRTHHHMKQEVTADHYHEEPEENEEEEEDVEEHRNESIDGNCWIFCFCFLFL